MSRLAIGLSLVATALSGYAAWASTRPSAEAERIDRLEADLDRLRVIETRVSNLEGHSGPGMTAPKSLEPTALAPAPKTDAASASPVERLPATKGAEERLADLTKRLSAVEERQKADDAVVAGMPGSARFRGARGGAFIPAGKHFYGTIEDAQSDLDLSGSQRADFDRVLADAKRDLDELKRIPDDEGRTWEQLNQEMMKGVMDGSMKFDFGKSIAFRNKTIPGRSETFGQADARIRTEARKRMRDSLTNDQQSKFDQAIVDPLMGGGLGGGPVSFSVFSTTTTDDAAMK